MNYVMDQIPISVIISLYSQRNRHIFIFAGISVNFINNNVFLTKDVLFNIVSVEILMIFLNVFIARITVIRGSSSRFLFDASTVFCTRGQLLAGQLWAEYCHLSRVQKKKLWYSNGLQAIILSIEGGIQKNGEVRNRWEENSKYIIWQDLRRIFVVFAFKHVNSVCN